MNRSQDDSDAKTPSDQPWFDGLPFDMKGRSVRGGAWTAGSQLVQTGIRLIALLVLARLLDPEAYGLIGMAVVVTGFLGLFSDLGLSAAVVQGKLVSREQLNSVFWISLGAGALLVGLTAAIAPIVAEFYDEPRVAGVLIGLSLVFPLRALGVPHQALMRRRMQFRAVATTEVGGAIVGSATAVIAAVSGAGYWALVLTPVAGTVASTVLSWGLLSWVPTGFQRSSGVRPMLAFGANLTGFNTVNHGVRNADDVLLGWRWGTESLGIYATAYRLLTLPLIIINLPVSSVAISGLSRLQDDRKAFSVYYLRALNLVAWASMPLAAVFVSSADAIIATVLGNQWGEAGRVFLFLSPVLMISPMRNTSGWLFISLGRTDRMFRWSLMSAPVAISAFVIGLPYGPEGVALGFTLSAYLLAVPNLLYATAGTAVSLRDIGRAVLWPATAAAVGMIASASLLLWVRTIPDAAGVFLALVICGLVALGTLRFSGEWTAVWDLRRSLRPPWRGTE